MRGSSTRTPADVVARRSSSGFEQAMRTSRSDAFPASGQRSNAAWPPVRRRGAARPSGNRRRSDLRAPSRLTPRKIRHRYSVSFARSIATSFTFRSLARESAQGQRVRILSARRARRTCAPATACSREPAHARRASLGRTRARAPMAWSAASTGLLLSRDVWRPPVARRPSGGAQRRPNRHLQSAVIASAARSLTGRAVGERRVDASHSPRRASCAVPQSPRGLWPRGRAGSREGVARGERVCGCARWRSVRAAHRDRRALASANSRS